MSSRRIIRLGGLGLMATAIIQAAATIYDPGLTANLNAIDSPTWIPWHVAFSVACTLVLPGLVALYLRQADRLGWPGETGFVLALFGSALTVSNSMLVGCRVED